MRQKFTVLAVFAALLFASCNNSNNEKKTTENNKNTEAQAATPTSDESGDWQSRYNKIAPKKLSDNVIELIGDEWMLVTAGNKDSLNTMTASWGSIGNIWGRPAAFMFIRDTRYTYQFLKQEDGYTLSFFDKEYKEALTICGTKSGKDTDKIKEAGLTPIETPSGLKSFAEARMIIECKKMFVQELDYNNFTDNYKEKIMEETYNNEPSKHQLFISEITNIWIKK